MKAHLQRVTKIWDQAPHSAFTGLTRFNGNWYCTFREATGHVSMDGTIRVITSKDGQEWSSAALFTSPLDDLTDLRDPKIIVAPDSRLMVMGAATSRDAALGRRNYAWYSQDGQNWSEPQLVSADAVWIWSLHRDGGTLYGAGYGDNNGQREVTLYHDTTGAGFEKVGLLHTDELFPNETALLMEGESGLALIRREWEPGQTACPPYNKGTALLGKSQAPFTEWTTQDLGLYIGGPAMLRLPNGKIVICGRKITSQHYTALWELDEENATLQELVTLPSANDCSYAGLVWDEDKLWVSYYSGHEGKANIYLAEVGLRDE
jgi:hypothetical protein